MKPFLCLTGLLLMVSAAFAQTDSSKKISIGTISPEDQAKIGDEQKLDPFISSADYKIFLFKIGSATDQQDVKESLEQEGQKLGKNFEVHTYGYDLLTPKTVDDARNTGHLLFANMVIWMDSSKTVNYAEVKFKDEDRFEDGKFPFSKTCITETVLAHFLYESEKYPEAIDHFGKVVACSEKNGSALYQLACSYHMLGDTANARKNYEEALEAKPDLAVAHNNLGLLLLSEDHPELAITHFESAATIVPDNSTFVENMADTYYQLENWISSEKAYTKLLELLPGKTSTLDRLALCCYQQGKLEEAIAWYEKLFLIDNNSEDAHYNCGFIYSQMQKYTEALDQFSSAIKINPDNARAQLGSAYMLVELNKKSEAKGHYLKAVKLEPSLKNPEFEKKLGM